MPSHKSIPGYGPLSTAKKRAKEAKSVAGAQSQKEGRREHRNAPDDSSLSIRSRDSTQRREAPSLCASDDSSLSTRSQNSSQLRQAPSLSTRNSTEKIIKALPPDKYSPLGAAEIVRQDSGSSRSYVSLPPVLEKKTSTDLERMLSLQGFQKNLSTDSCSGSLQQRSSRTSTTKETINPPPPLQIKYTLLGAAGFERRDSGSSSSYGSLRPAKEEKKKKKSSDLERARSLEAAKAVDVLLIQGPGSLRRVVSCTTDVKKKKSSNPLPPRPTVDKRETRSLPCTEKAVDERIDQSPGSLRQASSCTKIVEKKKLSNQRPPKPPVEKKERRSRVGTEKSANQPIIRSPASLRRVSSSPNKLSPQTSSGVAKIATTIQKAETNERSPASLRRVSSSPNKLSPRTSNGVANIATTVQKAESNVTKDSDSVRSYGSARKSKSNSSKKSGSESKSVTSEKDTSAESFTKQDEATGELPVQEPPGFFYLHDEVASVDSSVTTPETSRFEELSLEDLVPGSMSKSVTFDDTVYIKSIPGYGPLGQRTKLCKKPSKLCKTSSELCENPSPEEEENILELPNEIHKEQKQEDPQEFVSQPIKTFEDIARDKTEVDTSDVSDTTGGAPDIEERLLELKEWLTPDTFEDTVEDSIVKVRSLDDILPVFDDKEAMERSIEVTYDHYLEFEQRCCASPDQVCKREEAEKENLDVAHQGQAKQWMLNQDQDVSELDLCVGFWTCQDPKKSSLWERCKHNAPTSVDEEQLKASALSANQDEGQKAAKPHTPEEKPKAASELDICVGYWTCQDPEKGSLRGRCKDSLPTSVDEEQLRAFTLSRNQDEGRKAAKPHTPEEKLKAAVSAEVDKKAKAAEPANAKVKETPIATKPAMTTEQTQIAAKPAKTTEQTPKTATRSRVAKWIKSERLEAAAESTNVNVEEKLKADVSTISKGEDNPKAVKPTKAEEKREDAASPEPDEKVRKQNLKLTKYEQRALEALVQTQQNLLKMMKTSDIRRVNELKEANDAMLKKIKAQIEKTEAVMIQRTKESKLVDSDNSVEERMEVNFMVVEAALKEQLKIENALSFLSQRDRNYSPRDIWTAENIDVPPALKRGLRTIDYDGLRREIAKNDVPVDYLEEAKKAMAEQLSQLRSLRLHISCRVLHDDLVVWDNNTS